MVDSGDSFLKGKGLERLRAEGEFQGLTGMGYDAVNLADGELSLGSGFYQKLLDRFPLPVVSANLTGMAGTRPYIILERAGLKIGITGITARIFIDLLKEPVAGLEVRDPIDSLKTVLTELSGKTDLVILLSHLGYQGTQNLLQYNDIKGIDLAIAGHGRKTRTDPELIGNTLLVQNSFGGEYLAALTLTIDQSGMIEDYRGESIALTDEMPEDPELKKLEDDFTRAEKDESKASQKRPKQPDTNELLKLTPQEFLELMKKEKAGAANPAKPLKVPLGEIDTPAGQ